MEISWLMNHYYDILIKKKTQYILNKFTYNRYKDFILFQTNYKPIPSLLYRMSRPQSLQDVSERYISTLKYSNVFISFITKVLTPSDPRPHPHTSHASMCGVPALQIAPLTYPGLVVWKGIAGDQVLLGPGQVQQLPALWAGRSRSERTWWSMKKKPKVKGLKD